MNIRKRLNFWIGFYGSIVMLMALALGLGVSS